MQSENISILRGNLDNVIDCDLFTKDLDGAVLFHCAGIIHPKKVSQFFDINVDGTKNIIEAAIKNRIKKVVVVSSNSPCGVNPNKDHKFDENDHYNPYMEYGRSKMMMEKLVKKYYDEGKIETVIIRPPWFYGPHQPARQTKFYKMIKDGKAPVVGNGENKRSMACTINISQGLIRSAILEKANGNTYWIADEKPYSFNDIIETIRNVMSTEFNINCKVSQIKLPNIVSSLAYQVDRIIQSFGLYNKEIHVLSEMNKTISCSIKKAKNELNYNPTIDLYKGTIMSINPIISEL